MKELETSVHLTNRKEDNTCGWQRARGREEEKVGELAENTSYGSCIVYCWDFGFYSEKWEATAALQQKSDMI